MRCHWSWGHHKCFVSWSILAPIFDHLQDIKNVKYLYCWWRLHPYTCRRKRSRYWSRHVHCRTCTLRHPLRCSKSNLWLKAKPGKTHFMFHVSAYFSFLPGAIHCRSDKKAIFSICVCVCVHYAVSSLAESQLTMTPTSNQCFSSSPAPAPAARSSFDCRAPPAPPSHRPQTPALLPWREQIAATMLSV